MGDKLIIHYNNVWFYNDGKKYALCNRSTYEGVILNKTASNMEHRKENEIANNANAINRTICFYS